MDNPQRTTDSRKKPTLLFVSLVAYIVTLTSCSSTPKPSASTDPQATKTTFPTPTQTSPQSSPQPPVQQSETRPTLTAAGSSLATGSTELRPGKAPAKWKDTSGENQVFAEPVLREGVGSAAINCPELPQPGINRQCTGHVDEGGGYAMIWAKKEGEFEVTNIWCQTPEDSKDFANFLTIDGKLVASGPGASDGKTRFFESRAIEDADGIHWYVIRRPKGSACPAVWDLGTGLATGASASVGAATFPLSAGPLCVILSQKGIVTKPGTADGICA